jgi:hypothetical protein
MDTHIHESFCYTFNLIILINALQIIDNGLFIVKRLRDPSSYTATLNGLVRAS